MYFNQKQPLQGCNIEDVYWQAFFVKPSLGHDAIIAWRFAKDRLADLVFLHRIGLRSTNGCPWCSHVGDSWHLLFGCHMTRDIWTLIKSLIEKLLSCDSVSFESIAKGFKSNSSASNLANYLATLGKSTIYNNAVSFLKGDRTTIGNYKHVFVARLKSRIFKEFAWHMDRDAINDFEKVWCPMEAVCRIADKSLLFSTTLNI